MNKKILITGANFNNKGAQSMLFVTVNEIRKRFDEAEIFFQTGEQLNLENYKIQLFPVTNNMWRIGAGGISSAWYGTLQLIKCWIRSFLKRDNFIDGVIRLRDSLISLNSVDLIIDISGFALGEKWDKAHNYGYIYKIICAKNRNIPMYILPQSIGPFYYEKNIGKLEASHIRKMLCKYLKYPKVIYAREKDGIKSLKEIGITENVRLSPDIVLQSSEIDLRNIFKNPVNLNAPLVKEENSVALVPNFQCVRHGDKKTVISLYISIINHLLRSKKEVYIIRHSNDDEGLCKMIYDAVKSDYLHLINDDLSCIEYDEITKKFNYIVASRFHGIVHALRNTIPCIALGWAIKYQELLKSVGMERYVFDITNDNIDFEEVMSAINDMEENLEANKAIITERLCDIRKNSCFGFLDEITAV